MRFGINEDPLTFPADSALVEAADGALTGQVARAVRSVLDARYYELVATAEAASSDAEATDYFVQAYLMAPTSALPQAEDFLGKVYGLPSMHLLQ